MASAAVEKAPPAKKPVFGEGEDEPKRPRETLEERKNQKYSFRKDEGEEKSSMML